MDVSAIADNFRRIVTTQYFDFEGRTSRQDFWRWMLAYAGLLVAALILDSILGLTVHPFTTITLLGFLLPAIAVIFRRLQDKGLHGAWALVGIVPILGWALLVYWLAQPGTVGENDFGRDPQAPVYPVRPYRPTR